MWVDVVSCVDGEKDQIRMLDQINEFALKHRLKWGQSKCKVMRVGKHGKETKEWNLGELKIQETESHKYLGDLITYDGKNTKDLESRQNTIQMKTVTINCLAEIEVLRGIETSVLSNLHEKQNISALLTNAELWTLNRGRKNAFKKN